MQSKIHEKPFEKRFEESKYMMQKYPDSVCCIIEKSKNCKQLDNIKKNKFIISKDVTIAELIYKIRTRILIDSRKSIFIYIHNILPMSNSKISDIYNKYKSNDGFLYITYSGENTFG